MRKNIFVYKCVTEWGYYLFIHKRGLTKNARNKLRYYCFNFSRSMNGYVTSVFNSNNKIVYEPNIVEIPIYELDIHMLDTHIIDSAIEEIYNIERSYSRIYKKQEVIELVKILRDLKQQIIGHNLRPDGNA